MSAIFNPPYFYYPYPYSYYYPYSCSVFMYDYTVIFIIFIIFIRYDNVLFFVIHINISIRFLMHLRIVYLTYYYFNIISDFYISLMLMISMPEYVNFYYIIFNHYSNCLISSYDLLLLAILYPFIYLSISISIFIVIIYNTLIY